MNLKKLSPLFVMLLGFLFSSKCFAGLKVEKNMMELGGHIGILMFTKVLISRKVQYWEIPWEKNIPKLRQKPLNTILNCIISDLFYKLKEN